MGQTPTKGRRSRREVDSSCHTPWVWVWESFACAWCVLELGRDSNWYCYFEFETEWWSVGVVLCAAREGGS